MSTHTEISAYLSFPLAPATWRFAPFISQLSLLAVLHGALALLTTVQQPEQLNTIHDPPVGVQRIPNPSYFVLRPAGFLFIKSKGRVLTANEVHFSDVVRNNVDGAYSRCIRATWTVSGDKKLNCKLSSLFTEILVICCTHIGANHSPLAHFRVMPYSLEAVIHYTY